MSTYEFRAIEFFGGPMDGHIICMNSHPKPFAFLKTTCRVTNNSRLAQLWRLLLFHGHPQLDRIAVYELGLKDDRTSYLYVRSTPALAPDSTSIAELLEVAVD